MKRTTIIIAALCAALALGSCKNSFTPAAIDASVSGAQTSAIVGAAAATPGTSPVLSVISGALLPQTARSLVLQVTNAALLSTADRTAFASAIALYPLTNTAAADGAYTRGTAITLGTPDYLISGTTTTMTYTIDLSAAGMSNLLELVVAGDKVTLGGAKALDTDGDTVVGEAGDDDFISYVTVTGGAATTGNQRAPQTGLAFAGTYGGVATASTAVTLAPITTVGGAFAQLNAATLGAAFVLQKFNATTFAWDAVTTTPTYNAVNGVTTLTLGAAMANAELYRVVETNPSNVKETATVRGYTRRLSLNNSLKTVVLATAATTAPATQSAATYSAASTFDTQSFNGFVTITFAGLGAQGIDMTSLTSANVKIYDTSINAYVPVSSFALVGTNGAGAVVRAYLAATYKKITHGYNVLMGPGAKDLGPTTASADDLTMGSWNAITAIPYFFTSVAGVGNI